MYYIPYIGQKKRREPCVLGSLLFASTNVYKICEILHRQDKEKIFFRGKILNVQRFSSFYAIYLVLSLEMSDEPIFFMFHFLDAFLLNFHMIWSMMFLVIVLFTVSTRPCALSVLRTALSWPSKS